MITIPWWVLPLAGLGGIGFCALMVTIWIGRIDSLVNARVDARFEALVALLTEPTAEPAPGLMPPVDPWSSWQTLHEGLPELAEPVLPEHPWLRDPTGQVVIPPAVESEPAAVVEEKPKPDLRQRFNKEPKAPKAPKEITVAAVVGDEVRSEKTSVKA